PAELSKERTFSISPAVAMPPPSIGTIDATVKGELVETSVALSDAMKPWQPLASVYLTIDGAVGFRPLYGGRNVPSPLSLCAGRVGPITSKLVLYAHIAGGKPDPETAVRLVDVTCTAAPPVVDSGAPSDDSGASADGAVTTAAETGSEG